MPGCARDSEARHWPVLLVSFVAIGLTHGLASSMGLFYIEWREQFPQSSALVGWLSSSMLTMLLSSSPISGALVNYFGVRRTVVAGSVLSFVGLLIASFAETFYVLFITIPFMAGLGFGLAYTGVMVIISEYFHEHYAMATGVSMSGASVGMVVLPIFFRFLIDQYGWQRALLITSALHANVMVCAVVMRPPKHSHLRRARRNTSVVSAALNRRTPSRLERQASASGSRQFEDAACGNALQQNVSRVSFGSGDNEGEGTVCVEQLPSQSNGLEMRPTCWQRVLEVLHHSGLSLFWTNRVYSSYMLSVVASASIYGVTLPYVAARAKSVGIPEFEASLLISIIGIGNLLSRPTHGRLLDTHLTHPAFLYGGFVALGAVAAPVIASVRSFPWFVVCAVLVGMSAGAYIPLQAAIVRRIVGRERFPGGFGMGLVCVAAGNMSSAAIGGHLFDVTGSYSTSFVYMAVTSGLSVVLMIGTHILWTRLVPDPRWPTVH